MLEGREFRVITDHKPLTYAFLQKLDKSSPRQIRPLNFISQFTTSFEFLPGKDNVVADSLSRIDSVYLTFDNNLDKLAKAQEGDEELKSILQDKNTSLNLKSIRWGPDHTTIVCDLLGDVCVHSFLNLFESRFSIPSIILLTRTRKFLTELYVQIMFGQGCILI